MVLIYLNVFVQVIFCSRCEVWIKADFSFVWISSSRVVIFNLRVLFASQQMSGDIFGGPK